MTQQRIYDFGAVLTQSRTKSLAANLWSPGLYQGLAPNIVGPDTFQLTPGALLLPNGILVDEAAPVNVVLAPSWPPAIPTDYTVTAEHADIQSVGGSAVIYVMQAGVLPDVGSPQPNSLTVLRIRHPGAVPINTGMFSSPPYQKNGSVLSLVAQREGTLVPPFGMFDVVAGSNIQQALVTHPSGLQHLCLRIRNTSATIFQTLRFRLRLPSFPQAKSIAVTLDLPTYGTLSLSSTTETVAADGSSIAVTPATSNGPQALGTPVVFTLANSLTAPTALGMNITLPGNSDCYLKQIVVQPL